MTGGIRPVEPGDFEAVARINRECFGYAAPEDAFARCLRRAKADTDQLLVCRVTDGEMIGYLHAQILRPAYGEETAYVHALAVAQAHRKRGVGRALLRLAESWARERGAKGMALHSGEERLGAHAFYRACGYSVRKRQMHLIKPLLKED